MATAITTALDVDRDVRGIGWGASGPSIARLAGLLPPPDTSSVRATGPHQRM